MSGNGSYQNEPSSISPANTSQSTDGDKADNAGAKRKREYTGARGRRVVDQKDSQDEFNSSNDPRESYLSRRARHEAESARRAALSPEERQREVIPQERRWVKNHLEPHFIYDRSGLPMELHHYPRFVLQIAPGSINGATCRLEGCPDHIEPGEYRIALTPGMISYKNGDYYHVRCFEHLLDMSSPHYAARFDADREKYMPDHGAQCILEEYISRWKLRVVQTQNRDNSPSSDTEHEAGVDENPSNRLTVPPTAEATEKWKIADEMYEQVRKAEIERREQRSRMGLCRVITEDKSEDEDSPWKITQYLLSESDPMYSKRHALSRALEEWDNDATLATTRTKELTEEGRRARATLPIKTVRQYSCVVMENNML